MTDQERIANGEQAQAALDRWLGPAFEAVNAVWTARMADIAVKEPWSDGKIRNLALALKISEEVRKQIEAVAADGKVALADVRHMRKLEELSPERKKWLGIKI